MLELMRTEELVFTTRAAGRDIDCRKDPFLGKGAIELDLAVASALELLEDDVVHARSGLDQRGRDDRERSAAVLRSDRAGRTEKGFGLGHRGGIEAAGKRAAGTALHGVVSASHAGDRIQNYDDILAQLHESARPLEH